MTRPRARRRVPPHAAGSPLTFALCGTLGCVRTTGPDELMLAVASPLDRPDAPSRVAWVVCVARDKALRATISPDLRAGDRICVEGHVEPRRGKVGKSVFYAVRFIATAIEPIPASLDDRGAGD